jgi:hypothetical protein
VPAVTCPKTNGTRNNCEAIRKIFVMYVSFSCNDRDLGNADTGSRRVCRVWTPKLY